MNLIILSPLANEIKKLTHIKKVKNMTFLEITNAPKTKSLRELLFALLKNIILRNTYPGRNDGNISLSIAVRIKAHMYNKDETNFDGMKDGNGHLHVSDAVSYVLGLILLKSTMIHCDTEGTIENSLYAVNLKKKFQVLPKYILFGGKFHNAPKTIILFNNKTCDLFGSVIIIDYTDNRRHGVCGIISNKEEYIIDSNRLIVNNGWSTCNIATYYTRIPI